MTTERPPRNAPAMPARARAESLVLVNTGNGKGKSTAAFGTAVRAIARDWSVAVVLDEITYPMNWGWIDTDSVVAAIADRHQATTVICTGRDAPQKLVDIADTATDMQQVKHVFERGVRARRGIDY